MGKLGRLLLLLFLCVCVCASFFCVGRLLLGGCFLLLLLLSLLFFVMFFAVKTQLQKSRVSPKED